jgi:hypothetical protein
MAFRSAQGPAARPADRFAVPADLAGLAAELEGRRGRWKVACVNRAACRNGAGVRVSYRRAA